MIRVNKSAWIVPLVLLSAGGAFGTVSWMKSFNNLYAPTSESTLKKAKCTICHIKSTGKGGLNSYGQALDGKSASPSSLKSIERGDADRDGASNITEIKAGTLPGDPRSKP